VTNLGYVTCMEQESRPRPPEVNVFNSSVDHDEQGWFVSTLIDGRRHVVSRHDSADAAALAAHELNESGNRTVEPDA
jgi:hypothetical protein